RFLARAAGRKQIWAVWRPGPTDDRGARRSPAEAGETVRRLLADAEEPGRVYGAS
ncbi:short-chain dehydrogenase, partial [Streptomyces anulatus]